MKEYALLPESEITAARAATYKVVSNFAVPYIFASHLVTDASGQESEIFDDYTLTRWIESDDTGFTPAQASDITAAVAKFNQGRGAKPKLPQVRGSAEYARSFPMGNKKQPSVI